MQTGSLAQCVVDFSALAALHKINYPRNGQLLIVSAVTEHPHEELRNQGIVLLHFEEYPTHPTGICDKDQDGTVNFVELFPPDEVPIAELLEDAAFA